MNINPESIETDFRTILCIVVGVDLDYNRTRPTYMLSQTLSFMTGAKVRAYGLKMKDDADVKACAAALLKLYPEFQNVEPFPLHLNTTRTRDWRAIETWAKRQADRTGVRDRYRVFPIADLPVTPHGWWLFHFLQSFQELVG